jgi:copper transport protein
MRRALRAGLVGLATALVVVFVGGVAGAHANLSSSDPADGARLAAAPDRVSLTFTETPDPGLSSVLVLDGTGNAVAASPAAPDAADPNTLVVVFPDELPDGAYTVSWHVVSQEDSHPTTGVVAFGVGVPAVPPSDVPTAAGVPDVSALTVIAKVLLYAGLGLSVASTVIGLWVMHGRLPARRVVLIGAGAAAVAGAALLFVAQADTLDVSVDDLASSAAGGLFVRLLVASMVAAALAVIAALVPRWTTQALAGAGAAAAMLIRADGGHAAAAPSSAWVQVGLQWVHLLAVGIWIGGLALVWARVRARRAQDPAPVDEVRRFSRIAGVAVLVIVATGAIRASNELGGLGWIARAFDTSYGTTLLTKIAVVVVLIALGAVNRYRSIPRLGDRPGLLRRVLAVELVGAVGVFALTGVLTSLPPDPPAAPGSGAPARLVVEASDFATTMRIRLTVTPGAPGSNRFDVRVSDFDSGEPLPVDRVALRFRSTSHPAIGEAGAELEPRDGTWTARGAQLSVPGAWEITVAVERGAAGVEVPMSLVVEDPRQDDVVTMAPGQPTVHAIGFPDGELLQVYLDPDGPGPGQVHFTAFDATGDELPVRRLGVVAVPPAGPPITLTPERFTPGHFITPIELSAGDWAFVLVAETRGGASLTASFTQAIEG